MYSRLIIDGNAVYEIDEECVQKKGKHDMEEEMSARKSKYPSDKKPLHR